MSRRRLERQRRLLRADFRNPRRPHRAESRAYGRVATRPFIRAARLEDYDRLSAVFQQGDRLHTSALPDVFRIPEGPARSIDYIADLLNSEKSAVLVAEVQGRIVGAVSVTIHEAPALPVMVPRRFAVISDVVVVRGFRHQGIGRMLMEQAQGWARARGVGQVELNVWEFNRGALAFYSKLGYRTASRRLRKSLG